MKQIKRFNKKQILIPVLAITMLLVGSSFKTDFFEIAKQIEIFTTLFKELNMNYVDEINPAELMDTAIKNMLEDLDPYTKFLNEQDVEEFKINNAGEYSGIGSVVRSFKDKLLIVEPYKGSPADKAGLKAGDEIVKIGDIDLSNFKDDASDLLKGANNTSVEVTYLRQGQSKTATITRSSIEIDAVPYYKMVDAKTGYIVLSKFNAKATEQTEKALKDLKGQGAERLILDLRGNPGGLLSEAINVTNLFVSKGELIVTTKSQVKKFNQEYWTKNKPVDTEIPLVVLVNGSSASASEIVSGSLQDLDRAVIMGARSFGKGLVQRPMKLTYGTQLKVTISRYYTPSGRCIQSLDYWHRDNQGHAVRKTTFNDFTTKNGRRVQDGGGVLPDVEITAQKTNALTRAMLTDNVIFDYATDYYYNNKVDNLTDFRFSDGNFDDFKKFVGQSKFDFETQTEKAIKESMAVEESDIFGSEVQEDYKKLLLAIDKSKVLAMDKYKKEIEKNLEDEIIKRYFYREGLYDYYLNHDESILAGTALLADGNKYRSILK